jgi:cation diffusion facilitator CzcD-associated flavoprotein CzcO
MTARPDTDFDVIIVGAGPAGLGVAVPLMECGITRICILEARETGAAFDHWPEQMRLITPSFHSNPFRQPDLNAITIDTSPADFIRSEHPTGREYAAYLRSVVSHYQLPVREGVKVEKITAMHPGFELETSTGKLTAKNIIWAAGEFFYPLDDDFDGAEHCIHNTRIRDWTQLAGDEFAIIGGYEDNGFLMDDLECCTDCKCAIPSEAAPPDARSRRYAEAMKSTANS